MTSFQQLVDIVKKLRGPGGCPWDKEQTHKSLAPYAIEEAYELDEAIQNEDEVNLKEELGDLLFQSILHSEIARQENRFDIEDVINHLNQKMVSRHPHVFSDVKVENSNEVLKNWEIIKSKEKKADPFDIPQSFPALLRAHKIGKRTRQWDFDWEDYKPVIEKVKEEIRELELALSENSTENIEEELGDVLFTVAQLSRHLGFDAETCLRKANGKFLSRFKKMDDQVEDFKSLERTEKEKLWNTIKKN